jgi:hypothetical protein
MNKVLHISQPLFCFASDLVHDALCLLSLAANEFSGLLLNLASEVLDSAFDLILVHGGFPLK